jgi:hypothetical protein
MSYVDILMKTLQNTLATQIKMHKIDEHFIMEIFYEGICDSIVDDLAKEGYTITKGSSSVG